MEKALLNLIAGLIVGLIIGGGLVYAFAGGAPAQTATVTETVTAGAGVTATVTETATTTETVTQAASALPSEIPIGVLLPLTGDLSSFGEKWKNAMLLAEQDINDYVAKMGLNVRFKFYIEDTKTSPEGALAALQTLVAKGIKLIIGPAASSEVAAIKSYADANKIVIFSPSSTAPSLAIAGDYIFRNVVTDIYQGKALAKLMWDCGVRKAVVIYRGNDWGIGLFEIAKERFEELGGQMVGVKYDPAATELSAEVRKASSLVEQFGVSEDVGVLLISYEDDGMNVLTLAANDPVLSQVKWFGSDGITYSTKIAEQIGDIMVKLNVMSTLMVPPESPKKTEFMERYKSKFGVEPDSYTLNIYDIAWIYALAILQSDKYDSEALAKVLPDVAEKYFGVSGWTKLDEVGDRLPTDYTIAKVVEKYGKYVWVDVGRYIPAIDTIQWLSS